MTIERDNKQEARDKAYRTRQKAYTEAHNAYNKACSKADKEYNKACTEQGVLYIIGILNEKLQCDECGRDFSADACEDAVGTSCQGCEHDLEGESNV